MSLTINFQEKQKSMVLPVSVNFKGFRALKAFKNTNSRNHLHFAFFLKIDSQTHQKLKTLIFVAFSTIFAVSNFRGMYNNLKLAIPKRQRDILNVKT